ncbi:hypothetical protein RSOLAG1IB_05055 [Rhizoctonia solani AG-1 IB]|uniref:Uncharacterized protein n=1 Tax=Thanatephorus cucumeris (strain AG1-IB / isolate 7/3/14) TaxID=1108050 RepID=A0A0B7G0R8_THACB|nr:hypothetical protein RSOLAG1IB_05055 [Rhizoctonia solani AG-1 IB]
MLPHCVVAGVAARLEKQRVAIYERLMSFTDPRVWFLCGSRFCYILHHLWHSAGVGGGAVTWDDYVQSRHAIVPI